MTTERLLQEASELERELILSRRYLHTHPRSIINFLKIIQNNSVYFPLLDFYLIYALDYLIYPVINL